MRFAAYNPHYGIYLGEHEEFPIWSNEPVIPRAFATTFDTTAAVAALSEETGIEHQAVPIQPSHGPLATIADCVAAGLQAWDPGIADFEAMCVGCGCIDSYACDGPDGPCHWLRLDRDINLGVCSCCHDKVSAWDRGEFTPGRNADSTHSGEKMAATI